MNNDDPTAITLDTEGSRDPRVRRMRGVAFHGDTPFDVPFISQIEGNLWTGGCEDGLFLPNMFKHVISLYPWERYKVVRGIKSESYNYMYDSAVPDINTLKRLTALGLACVGDGPTLIHCQAGLNRSGLIAARVLMELGRRPADAIRLLRAHRSPAVLCNPAFEHFLLTNCREACEP